MAEQVLESVQLYICGLNSYVVIENSTDLNLFSLKPHEIQNIQLRSIIEGKLNTFFSNTRLSAKPYKGKY